ncbi:MAG: [FeFe] hydrogenase H-cluster maturation GTPase HydF [Peptoniphilaceae bacterium]
MNKTPNSNRFHIGIFGNTNAGKSTILNLITNQNISLVSSIAGTTTDPVYKAMEINGVGPVLFIDTAGFNDGTELGIKRESRSLEVINEVDLSIIVIRDSNIDEEKISKILSNKKPAFVIFNDFENEDLKLNLKEKFNLDVVEKDKEEILNKIKSIYANSNYEIGLLDGIIKENMLVVLVMPQDIQAPKGRLILPQVQTIRALLDGKCICVSCTKSELKLTLDSLKRSPDLIITDSQIFDEVYKIKDGNSKITSFSVLMAKSKGDIDEFVKGAKFIDELSENSKILISEACTHAPLEEDIGRVKIPRLLREKFGEKLQIDFSRGVDYPKNISDYNLVIMCGSCMFNRAKVLSRIYKAKEENVPVTNYGLTIAKLKGILDKITY